MSAVKDVLAEFAQQNVSTMGSVMSGAQKPPVIAVAASAIELPQDEARHVVVVLDEKMTSAQMQQLGKVLGDAGYHGVFQSGQLAEQMYVRWVKDPPSHTDWKRSKGNG